MLPHSLVLLLTTSISLISAHPTTSHRRDTANHPTAEVQLPVSSLAEPRTLPSTPTLKHVVLGLGHQNYTCNKETGAWTAIGATAALYDIKPVLKRTPWMLNSIPSVALSASGLAIDTQPSGADDASIDNADYYRELSLGNSLKIRQVGAHWFNAAKAPTFDFPSSQGASRLVAKRIDGIPAPKGSCPGPEGTGAVDWLLLGDNEQGGSYGGLSHVYRVVTAGGKATSSCKDAEEGSVLRVPYATEYWFYGPAERRRAY